MSFVVWVVVVFAVTSIPAHAEGASVAPSPGPRLQFAVASAAQPQRAQPGQEEFVPIDELPAEDRLPAAPLLVAAYAFAWVAILGYLWSIWRRLARVERELADATRTAGERRT